jgi:hypothetical protein
MKKYVIEARDSAGQLKLDCEQPEEVFGLKAINGITDWGMSRVIFKRIPNATLTGDTICTWPSLINPHWIARLKTW